MLTTRRAGALFLAFLLSISVNAQQGVPVFTDQVEISLVNVDVVVLDAAGKPVTGLTAADFIVLDDGKRVEVKNVDAPAPVMPPAETVTPGAAVQATPPRGPHLSVIVFVDCDNSVPAKRNAAIDQLRPMLRELLDSRRGSVMVATGSLGVRVVEPLSDDPAKVTAALDRAARETGAGAMANIDASVLSRVIDRGVDMTTPFGQADAQAQLTSAKTAAQGAYDRGKSYLASLTNFVGALGGVPGRKVMFWVSDGFVLRPGERLIQQWEAAYAGATDESGRSSSMDVNRFDLSTDMTTLMHRAKASEVHIVTIPPAGIVTSNVSAEQAVMEADRMIGAATMEQLGQQQTMQNLAASTGGELLVGGNVSGRASNALTALDTAYSIGFLDPHPGDGKVHTLKISVSRPDLKVRHAESYLDQTFEGKAAEANLSAIYMDSADNPLEIELSVRSMTAAKGHDFSVVLLTMIPLGNVILSPAGEVHEGKLALWLAARDVSGKVIQSGRQALPLRVPNASIASAQGQTAGFTFTMNLPAGSARAAVTVVDQTGHARSTVPLTFVVGPSAPEGTAR